MRRVLLALVLPLLAGSAAATWYGPGTAEPDTKRDERDGYMFKDVPRNASLRKVYFNGFLAMEGTSVNPNVGLLGTTVFFPASHARAMLGVWVDCNKDDYVGHAEAALQDYVSALADPLVCPPDSLHNSGGWVSEMIMIGMVDPCEYEKDAAVRARLCATNNPVEPTVGAFAPNERVLYSNDTYVWADHGAPGSIPRAECVLGPAPRGTTSGTGAFLRYVDCQDGYRIGLAVNALDPDGSRGLRFEDPHEPQDSSSLLNVAFPVTLLGAPDGRAGLLQQGSGRPAFVAHDCAARVRVFDPTGSGQSRGMLSEVAVEDPTPGSRLTGPVFPLVITGYTFRDEDGNSATPGVLRVPLDADGRGTYAWVSVPRPGAPDARGSAWDAAEATVDATRGDCDPQTRSAMQTAWPGASIEDGDHVVPPARKDQTSLTFTFYDGHRGFNSNVDPHTGSMTPSDGGLMAHRHGRGGSGPLWSATVSTVEEPQLVRRGDLDAAPAIYVTYYARVGGDVETAENLKLPSTAPGAYGAENCGSATSGLVNGWECDPDLWWRDSAGRDVTPRYARGERLGRLPGDPFDLRDVDCHDGALVPQEGIHASLAPFSKEGACPWVPRSR